MGRLFRSAVSSLAVLGLLANQLAQPAFAEAPTRADYEACQAKDEQAFRTGIEALTVKALANGLSGVDYRAIIGDEWRKGGLDELIDKRVDIAIEEIKSETGWSERLQTLFDKEKAQQLATQVAERVYRSEAVKAAIEGLAIGVSKQIERPLTLALLDAAGPATQCLQAFLAPRYGTSIARMVTLSAGKELGLDPASGGAKVSVGSVLSEGSEGIAGAVVLIVRRQLSNLATRVGQRIIGSVLSRLVLVVADGVGLVLIAKDVWDFRHGVMPIIASEMKSKGVKDKVQAEIASATAQQIKDHAAEIGTKTAERIIDVWGEFRRAHSKALELAERHAGFKTLLDTTKPEQLPRLDEVVGLLLAGEGEAGVLKRLGDGTLARAVSQMPVSAMTIARETRSIEAALGWEAIAGADLDKVVANEIHKRASPQDFSKTSLDRVLALNDRLAITRLASLKPAARETLFDLDTGELRSLARSLTETELDTLARYLSGLTKAPRERVLRSVAASPNRMQILASERVRDAIIGSRDQSAAVEMMLRANAAFDPVAIRNDVQSVLDGNISPVLLWDKHPGVVVAAGALALILLLMLRRLLFGGRRHPTPPPPAAVAPKA